MESHSHVSMATTNRLSIRVSAWRVWILRRGGRGGWGGMLMRGGGGGNRGEELRTPLNPGCQEVRGRPFVGFPLLVPLAPSGLECPPTHLIMGKRLSTGMNSTLLAPCSARSGGFSEPQYPRALQLRFTTPTTTPVGRPLLPS